MLYSPLSFHLSILVTGWYKATSSANMSESRNRLASPNLISGILKHSGEANNLFYKMLDS